MPDPATIDDPSTDDAEPDAENRAAATGVGDQIGNGDDGGGDQPTLSKAKYDVLRSLAHFDTDDKTPVGRAVLRVTRSRHGQMDPGNFYRHLTWLQDQGLVTVAEYDGRTNTYHLTDAGRAYLAREAAFTPDPGQGADTAADPAADEAIEPGRDDDGDAVSSGGDGDGA